MKTDLVLSEIKLSAVRVFSECIAPVLQFGWRQWLTENSGLQSIYTSAVHCVKHCVYFILTLKNQTQILQSTKHLLLLKATAC